MSEFSELYEKCKSLTDKLLEAAEEDKQKQKKVYARKLRDYRIVYRLTQDELAKKLGVTKMEIIRWEKEKNMPAKSALNKMKQAGIL